MTVHVSPKVTRVTVRGGVGPRGERGPQGPPGDGTAERIELTGNTSLEPISGNTYTNADVDVVASLPPSGTLGNVFIARFRLTHSRLFRVQTDGADVIRFAGAAKVGGGGFVSIEHNERDACADVEYVGGGVYLVTTAMMEWSLG